MSTEPTVLPDLPNLKEMPEIERLRWLVNHMESTEISRAALSGMRWKCPVCFGVGRVSTGKTEQHRKEPGEPGYYATPPGHEWAPDQYVTRTVFERCALCHGTGRLDHAPEREQVVTETWR